jgi:hypothetical protein
MCPLTSFIGRVRASTNAVLERQFFDNRPNGFDFAPWPMLVATDSERYAIERIPGPGAELQAMWRLSCGANREIAAHLRDFDRTALRVEGEPPPGEFIVTRGPTIGRGEDYERGGARGGKPIKTPTWTNPPQRRPLYG